ncbi:MAG: sigma-70 family RNA polymerase sigma factor [Gemmatirosa sp.]|nr:sigma-70 family RNA polymerase sigma factor [Gemmatirosa sp.]
MSGGQPEGAREGEITVLLRAASAGDSDAFDAAFSRVYDELHRLANQVRRGRASDTMGATALVHEAYLKLSPSADVAWEGRRHFMRVAARAMRQVLVGAARERMTAKRGGGDFAVTLDEGAHGMSMRADELVALDEALSRLTQLDERQARVVELRYFAGLTIEEAADTLGVSAPTVQRDWRAARAWLALELGPDDAAPPGHDAH